MGLRTPGGICSRSVIPGRPRPAAPTLGPVTSDNRPLAVFDLDNTLAATAHRQHFLERKPKDWEAFFAAAPDDPPLEEGVALCREAAEECEVVYLTGRPERCRRATVEWLAEQGLPEGRSTCGATVTSGRPG